MKLAESHRRVWRAVTIVALSACVTAILSLASCSAGKAPPPVLEAEGAPADQNIGERLFVETRFA